MARSGRVIIANPLGSGILENPIFLRYLPNIAKSILGRELRLPSVQTYWCGEKHDLAYVMDNLRSLVIKPISRHTHIRSLFAGSLSKKELEELKLRIKADPVQYVAQPSLVASHIPTFNDGQLEPRPAILRSFAVGCESSYSIMPGGLTRVGNSPNSFVISNQAGSKSKDTWVIASEPERTSAAESSADDTPFKEADLISLPSRVVENLFWMGRYAERAEASLRVLRSVFILLNGEQPISPTCKRILLETVTEITATHPGFIEANEQLIEQPEKELLEVVRNANRLGSVRSNLNAMINCADESKELLSSDTIRVINDTRDALSELDSGLSVGLVSAPEEALDPLVSALMSLSGLAQESMVRDFGWRFMELGRRLERALLTTTLIENILITEVNESDQAILIEAMLWSLESLISYRRRYRARMGVQSSLDLVVMDTSNPRSLLFQIEQLSDHIDALPKTNESRHQLTAKERAIIECETLIKLSVLTELSTRENGKRVQLEDCLSRTKKLLWGLSEFISDGYFDHRENSQQLVRSIWMDD